jgi:hypothetical protein
MRTRGLSGGLRLSMASGAPSFPPSPPSPSPVPGVRRRGKARTGVWLEAAREPHSVM